jgi:hypothetical protein
VPAAEILLPIPSLLTSYHPDIITFSHKLAFLTASVERSTNHQLEDQLMDNQSVIKAMYSSCARIDVQLRISVVNVALSLFMLNSTGPLAVIKSRSLLNLSMVNTALSLFMLDRTGLQVVRHSRSLISLSMVNTALSLLVLDGTSLSAVRHSRGLISLFMANLTLSPSMLDHTSL